MSVRARGAASLVLAALGSLAALAACEAIVPDDLPPFLCIPGAGSCPAGTICDTSSHSCIAVDASVDGAVPVPPLTGCSTLGCQCSGPQDCASAICGDTTVVSTAVYDAAEKTSFCTKPCCTSADCDLSTVCLATGTGESYCVRPEWLGRGPSLGTLAGGAPCEADAACRSGLCTAAGCADVCCSTAQSAAECVNGDVCQFGTFPGRGIDAAYVPFCAAPVGAAASGSSCSTSDDTCKSALCAPDGHCHDACRDTADCGDPSLECGYAFPGFAGNQIVAVCETSFGTVSQGGQGATCQNNDECQTGFCDASSMECTDVCFADADCTPPGWRCRPDVTLVFGGMTYSVFACGM